MKTSKWLATVTGIFFLGAPIFEAEAKRLGGGMNIGRVAPSRATPPTVPPKQAPQQQSPAQPQPAQQQASQAASPAASQAAASRSSWMGPLAGLAAGLGLAALASYLGLGEELLSLMLILLAVVAAFAIFRMLSGKKAVAGAYGQPAMARSGYGNADLGAEARPGHAPWSGSAAPIGASSAGAPTGDMASHRASASVVSQEEIDQFLKVARDQFERLQFIWDNADIHALAEFCTPQMTRELSHQIADRKGAANHTEIVSLNTQWMGMNDGTDDFGNAVDEVQVRFSGLVRETEQGLPVDFDEIWTLQRSKKGDSGWLLAGIFQAS